ncbi:MAG: helix-turn-helix domain-containing protein [Bdellovibrionales bacterium]|nr:helix-turn-helix domain-containing protein [Bdellovibrionales bacterium]
MPWKESKIVDERMKFVTRALDGEKVIDLCREFGISRKTGHKILNRFKKEGIDGLKNKSKAPIRNFNKTHPFIESLIVNLKKEKQTWGAPKIRERLIKLNPDLDFPSKTTVHSILDKHGLVGPKKKKRFKAKGTNLSVPQKSNDLWCTDFKGQFRMTNNQYCYH